MDRFKRIQHHLWVLFLVAGLLVIYVPGLHNNLIFDDIRLSDLVFNEYGALWPLKPRLLSYGSFVWLQQIAGEGWWKQRLFNVGLHLCVVLALYALFRQLIARISWPEELAQKPHLAASTRAALIIGVLFYAFNPVAAYGVAYLIQRSILMATLFVVLACLAFVKGIVSRRWPYYLAAGLAYVLAMLSKEHAVMAPTLALPLYIYLRRPSLRQIGLLMGAAVLLLLPAVGLLSHYYVGLVGQTFDEQSAVFVKQLAQIDPAIPQHAYPLSVLNQAALFFRYGLLWVIPNVDMMAIDLRPGFPTSYAAMPQLLGALAFVALMLGSFYLLIKREGILRYLGLCLLIPALLFCSEFATVWIQDPFVLYRSYLWAIALPGIFILAVAGVRPRILYQASFLFVAAFGGLAIERVMTMKDTLTVWTDAAKTVDRQAGANAVGRWRPFLNRGAYYLDNNMIESAYQDFVIADSLDEVQGLARFNSGMALSELKKPKEALQAYNEAEQRGFAETSLYYQRGVTQYDLGQFEAARADFTKALASMNDANMRADTLRRRADAALQSGQFAAAREDYNTLLQSRPRSYELRLNLAQTYLGEKNGAAALPIFDALINARPLPPAYYGRAVSLMLQGRKSEAVQSLDQAIAMDPHNPAYQVQRKEWTGQDK